MWDWFTSLSRLQQAALGGLGTWFLALLGTLPVLVVKRVNRRAMDAVMGAAGGIMVAAACLVPVGALSFGTREPSRTPIPCMCYAIGSGDPHGTRDARLPVL